MYSIISGAAIDSINQSTGSVRYQYKCDSCGALQGSFSSSSSSHITGSFKCKKCGADNKVSIKKL
jgi:hypothetical protein